MAEPIRVASYAGDFSRKGPGLMLRELLKEDPVPGLGSIAMAQPDILLLTDFDFDAGHAALTVVRERLAKSGLSLPHSFALRPNTGMGTGLDMDGDGRLGGPRDAQGYGWFSGQGGQAILSRWPMKLRVDYSAMLWKDVPDTMMAEMDIGAEVQRLSTTAHWAVEVLTPQGPWTLLTIAATPPLFDGPEDRNGRRNHDEVLLWLRHLDGELGPVGAGPKILLGNLNLDPDRGDGLRAAVARVLSHPALQDPLPGQPTVEWSGPGKMRVSYVLPTRELSILDAGVMAPEPDAGPHRLVWVDLLASH